MVALGLRATVSAALPVRTDGGTSIDIVFMGLFAAYWFSKGGSSTGFMRHLPSIAAALVTFAGVAHSGRPWLGQLAGVIALAALLKGVMDSVRGLLQPARKRPFGLAFSFYRRSRRCARAAYQATGPGLAWTASDELRGALR
jgi:hypothetical protein